MHVECVQVLSNWRGVILITLKESVKIEQFCRYDVMEVTNSGSRSTIIEPALKKEVVVTVKGIHPNTKDGSVLVFLLTLIQRYMHFLVCVIF